jgi:hypothetical protein
VDYDPAAVEALLSGILTSPISRELSYRLDQALEVTDALWDLVPIVVAVGEAHDRQAPAEAADLSPAGQHLTPDSRSRARAVADAVLAMQETATSEDQLDESAVSGLTKRDAAADPFGILGRLMNIPEQAALGVAAIEQAANLSADELFYFRVYVRAKLKSERTPMLLRALFITAVGTVEPLVTRLVLLLLYYADPQSYRSLADPALEKEARRLCFGPPGKWRKSLVGLGVKSVATAVDWERLAILWEDRNVVAHRGSVTDSQHSAITGTQEGSVINPDVDAIRSVIDLIGGTRYALVACIWEHLAPGSGSLAAELAGPVLLESLRAGRWEQAELLGKLQEQLIAGEQDKASVKVNRWLATDVGRGPEAIRAEVEAWDLAELPRVYTLARHVLLREDDQAVALLGDLLTAGDLTQTQVDTWPLFDRLRVQGRLPRP